MLAVIITAALGSGEMHTSTFLDAICPKKYKIEVDRMVLMLMKRLMHI